MKTLTIDEARDLLRIVTATALKVNTARKQIGLALKRMRICPTCKEVSESSTCAHQKKMH